MSRLSQQGRRKWRSRGAKERARVRARRILAKYFRAYRDAALELYNARAGQGLFADFVKPLADANGFQKAVEHVPATGAQIVAERDRLKVLRFQEALAPGEQCDSCCAGPPLFEHIYLDCTMRYCSRCKADAIEAEEAHDD